MRKKKRKWRWGRGAPSRIGRTSGWALHTFQLAHCFTKNKVLFVCFIGVVFDFGSLHRKVKWRINNYIYLTRLSGLCHIVAF